MLDRVKADRAAGNGLFDGSQNSLGPEYLEQPQDLNELTSLLSGFRVVRLGPGRGAKEAWCAGVSGDN
jgi:hypothetical protein